VAVNLTGIDKSFVKRGSWLSQPGSLAESRYIDMHLELLPEAQEMIQRSRVHVHHGTARLWAG
jgi:selenocysteine-specific elongation factor